MKTANIQIESNRRCDAPELEKILGELPLNVEGTHSKLSARMGLGRIIYIEPLDGTISTLKIGGVPREIRNYDYLVFTYKKNTFDVVLSPKYSHHGSR